MSGGQTGFAGLGARLSDNLELVRALDGQPAASATAPRSASSAAATPQPTRAPPPKGEAAIWILGSMFGGLVALGLYAASNTSSSPAEFDPAPVADAAAAAPAADALATDTLPISEVIPPVGSGLQLNVEQIAYCLAEERRLKAGDPEVNSQNDAQIDLFNSWVDDYNSRCGHYRYKESDKRAADAFIEARGPALTSEGIWRVRNAVRNSGAPAADAMMAPAADSEMANAPPADAMMAPAEEAPIEEANPP